jgi:hypothetical protein
MYTVFSLIGGAFNSEDRALYFLIRGLIWEEMPIFI